VLYYVKHLTGYLVFLVRIFDAAEITAFVDYYAALAMTEQSPIYSCDGSLY